MRQTTRRLATRRAPVQPVFTEPELRLLYALVQHDAAGRFGCPLENTSGGAAGTHQQHQEALTTAQVKLSDALLDLEDAGERP